VRAWLVKAWTMADLAEQNPELRPLRLRHRREGVGLDLLEELGQARAAAETVGLRQRPEVAPALLPGPALPDVAQHEQIVQLVLLRSGRRQQRQAAAHHVRRLQPHQQPA
jgi:hypothetical protein